MKKLIMLLLPMLFFAQRDHYNYNLPNDAQPLTIRVNAVLLQRGDGTANFRQSVEEERLFFSDYLEHINVRYANIVKPTNPLSKCYNGPDFYKDVKVRVKFNIIEVRNTWAWNYLNSGINPDDHYQGTYYELSPQGSFYLNKITDSLSAIKTTPKGVFVYYTTNGDKFDEVRQDVMSGKNNFTLTQVAASQYPSYTDLKRSSAINYLNVYLKYLYHKYAVPGAYNVSQEASLNWLRYGSNLWHELGHSMGLSHENEYHGTYECGESFMSYGAGSHDYIEPTEIKLMHYTLSRTNMMQFVTEDSWYGTTELISENVLWSKRMRLYSSIEIAPNTSITIRSVITMPPQAWIKLNVGSKIIFRSGGRIEDAYGALFTKYRNNRANQVIRK